MDLIILRKATIYESVLWLLNEEYVDSSVLWLLKKKKKTDRRDIIAKLSDMDRSYTVKKSSSLKEEDDDDDNDDEEESHLSVD